MEFFTTRWLRLRFYGQSTYPPCCPPPPQFLLGLLNGAWGKPLGFPQAKPLAFLTAAHGPTGDGDGEGQRRHCTCRFGGVTLADKKVVRRWTFGGNVPWFISNWSSLCGEVRVFQNTWKNLGGGFKRFYNMTLQSGEIIHFWPIFEPNGLKPPPSYKKHSDIFQICYRLVGCWTIHAHSPVYMDALDLNLQYLRHKNHKPCRFNIDTQISHIVKEIPFPRAIICWYTVYTCINTVLLTVRSER